jgi:hypothetical protein
MMDWRNYLNLKPPVDPSMSNPVGTSTMQRVTNPSPDVSPLISAMLNTPEQKLGRFWAMATGRAKPNTGADLPELTRLGNEAYDYAAGFFGQTTPMKKVDLNWVREALKKRGVDFTETASRSMSDTFGPSASHYFKVGDKTIRISDHSYGPGNAADLRYGMSADEATQAIELAFNPAPQKAVDPFGFLNDAQKAERARKLANDSLLEAEGLGHLTGTARKKALKKLSATE